MDPLRRLAETQHGIVTSKAAGRLAIPHSTLDRQIGDDFDRLARGVFRVVGSVRTWRQEIAAAVAAAGDGAVASHASAAALWKLPGFPEGPIVVTRPRQIHHRGLIGVVHETTLDLAKETREIDGIAVASPALTLLGICASDKWGAKSARAMDNAGRMGLVTPPTLLAFQRRWGGRGRPGAALFRRLIEERGAEYVATESELEDLTLEVLAAAGLPEPERQVDLGDDEGFIGRADFLYRPRVIIEAISRRYHSSWADQIADERRRLRLTAAGFHVIEVTWHRLVREPSVFVRAVKRAIALQS